MVRRNVVQGRQSKMMDIDIDVVFLLNFASLNKIALFSSVSVGGIRILQSRRAPLRTWGDRTGRVGQPASAETIQYHSVPVQSPLLFFGFVFASAAFELSP
jgi:hypothetical protein